MSEMTNNDFEVNLFPNPTNDILNINIKDTNYDNSFIELFDIYGKY